MDINLVANTVTIKQVTYLIHLYSLLIKLILINININNIFYYHTNQWTSICHQKPLSIYTSCIYAIYVPRKFTQTFKNCGKFSKIWSFDVSFGAHCGMYYIENMHFIHMYNI